MITSIATPRRTAAALPLSWLRAMTGGMSGRVGLLLTVLMLVLIVFGPLLAPYPPTKLLGKILQLPSAAHWLGTDQLGRDVWSRFLYGGRSVILLPAVAVAIAFALGGSLGLVAGFSGGVFDRVVTRVADILMSIPPLLLVMVLVVTLGSSDRVLILVTGLWFAPRVARIVRGATSSIRTKDYVLAARARGENAGAILWSEVVPNISGTLLVELALRLNYAIVFITTLNFLGLGVQPPSSDWGLVVSQGRAYLAQQPFVAGGSALGIALLTLGINLIADQLSAHLARNVQLEVGL